MSNLKCEMENKNYIERHIQINGVESAFCKTPDNVPHIIYNVKDKRNSVLYPFINTNYLHELFADCEERFLLQWAKLIIEQKPAFPFVADVISDSHYYALYAQEYVGVAFVIRREKCHFLRYELSDCTTSSYIEKMAKSLTEMVNFDIPKQQNYEHYVWLKDKLVRESIYPTLQVRGRFPCPYCGKNINVLTTTYGEDNEYVQCHNCGLEYHIEPIECEFKVNQSSLDYKFYELQRQIKEDKKR